MDISKLTPADLAYIEGFVKQCQDKGVDPEAMLEKMAKGCKPPAKKGKGAFGGKAAPKFTSKKAQLQLGGPRRFVGGYPGGMARSKDPGVMHLKDMLLGGPLKDMLVPGAARRAVVGAGSGPGGMAQSKGLRVKNLKYMLLGGPFKDMIVAGVAGTAKKAQLAAPIQIARAIGAGGAAAGAGAASKAPGLAAKLKSMIAKAIPAVAGTAAGGAIGAGAMHAIDKQGQASEGEKKEKGPVKKVVGAAGKGALAGAGIGGALGAVGGGLAGASGLAGGAGKGAAGKLAMMLKLMLAGGVAGAAGGVVPGAMIGGAAKAAL